MDKIMSACFTFVQLPGEHLALAGHYTMVDGENRITVHRQFRVDDFGDATDPQMWVQMATAKLCDLL